MIAVSLAAVFGGAQAQTTVDQTLSIVSENGVNRTTSSGAHGQLADQASTSGTDFLGNPFQTSASVTSSSSAGALTASTYATFGGAGSVQTSSAVTQYDNLTLHTSTAFEPLTVRYSFAVTGANHLALDTLSNEAGVAGFSTWSVVQQFGSSISVVGATTQMAYDGSTSTYLLFDTPSASLSRIYTVETQLLSGEATFFSMSLYSAAALNTYYLDSTSGQGGSVLNQSLYWGGISSVTRADGTAVNFTLSSDSGVDYTRSFIPVVPAVPEPSSILLMLAGVAALGAVARRRVSERGTTETV
ncbi:PEP-CTERM sorting domain-containing protein [Roseateles amylovorans]|uniref:PEP-CTERM sorting domain-containing protein n=1 Tax=Roseateles amylovorans TaxID=2978473 RepID=A0ABY6AU10_9BURK|nr:PEP-CTERM sorting domain-containing protein [Roseateles amylovorans]UXH76709.1 PEP-CTERM sorting domain-containing protein [Roseateles amylovorans]